MLLDLFPGVSVVELRIGLLFTPMSFTIWTSSIHLLVHAVMAIGIKKVQDETQA